MENNTLNLLLEKQAALANELNKASDAYYNGKTETMSDYEWNEKFDELAKLENETGVVLPGSPTASVSEDNIKGNKVEHEYPALSLAKTKKLKDLIKWADGRATYLSWKLDGLTLVVTYNDGKLVSVVTRGDGHIGTDVTHLAAGINNILPTIPYKGRLVIRGEAVISYADFEAYVTETGSDYANPRNLASGSLSLDNVNELAKRHVKWLPFTLVYADNDCCDYDMNCWGDRMEFLYGLDFDTVDAVRCENEKDIENAVAAFTKQAENNQSVYPVDGLVLVYADWAYSQTGSVTGHHATRAGFAFKWEDEAVVTKLKHIEWSCAAWAITPVAVFEPVKLEGTTVERASLCNISECKRLKIGDGSEISVIKANKIIPKIVSATPGKLIIPDKCPVCGAPTKINVSTNSRCEILVCTNDNCKAKFVSKLSKLVSRHALNIDGMSEATLQTLHKLGWLNAFADIYELPNHAAEWKNIDGFGDRSVSKLLEAVEKSKVTTFRNFLYACCISGIGKDQSKLISNFLAESDFEGTTIYEKFINAINAKYDFSNIDGIGPVRNNSLYSGWTENHVDYERLASFLVFTDVIGGNTDKAASLDDALTCKGLTFVITGDVHHFKNRDAFKEYVETHGGKVAGSISGKTNFLVCNDVSTGTGKLKKAANLGVSIITEDEFVEKFSK